MSENDTRILIDALTCTLPCLVKLLEEPDDCGNCIGIEIVHTVRVHGHANSASFRVYAERRFKKMVSVLGYFGVETRICIL
jgi:hypothetical protein